MNPPKDKKYMSFSLDENSGQGESDEFGDIRVDFDATKLYGQGGIKIVYTLEFFKNNPDLCEYVTGYESEAEYYQYVKGENELTWEEYIDSFKGEQEVALKKLKMVPGLIKKVTVWDADERDDIPQIKEVLKKYNIKVEVPWEQES